MNRPVRAAAILLLAAGCSSPSSSPSRTQVDPSTLDVMTAPPQPVKTVAPEYPEAARREKLEDDLRLRVLVAPDGHVQDVQVLEIRHEVFRDAAIEAVKQWRFEPARGESGPRPAWIVIPVAFHLER